jgi:hypothetical protein
MFVGILVYHGRRGHQGCMRHVGTVACGQACNLHSFGNGCVAGCRQQQFWQFEEWYGMSCELGVHRFCVCVLKVRSTT